jgi:hypothetical protein
MLDSELDEDVVPYAVPIHMAAGALPNSPIPSLYVFRSEPLLHLALPLEAEGLVDPQFSGNGEDGHGHGDAANVSDQLC